MQAAMSRLTALILLLLLTLAAMASVERGVARPLPRAEKGVAARISLLAVGSK